MSLFLYFRGERHSAAMLGRKKTYVGSEAGTSILLGVVDFEYKRLISRHSRKVMPPMLWVIRDLIGLTDAVGIAPLGRDQIVR